MKIAVLFPGIGYHCDKPLLYYSARLAKAAGYEVQTVPYTGFPGKVRGDAKKLRKCFDIARSQADKLLSDVKWDGCRDILFIGKSIGTAVASEYALDKGLEVRSVLLTPLEETFRFIRGSAVAFHGTADPWANTAAITAACRAAGIPLCLTEGANHSLETGDALGDVRALEAVLARVDAFIREGDGPDVLPVLGG